jgi:hypothetical protein
MEMSAESTKFLRTALLPLATLCLASVLWACADKSDGTVGLHSDTTTTNPNAPQIFDLRFKGVGVLSTARGVGTAELLAGTNGPFMWSQYDSAVGSPVSLGGGLCRTTFCEWALTTFALPSNVARLATIYRVGVTTDLPLYAVTGMTGDTVITSVDLEPGAGVFALSEFAMSQSAGYQLFQQRLPVSELQAAASSEGGAKRVITAVSFDQGQVRYFSYAWDHDTTVGYDAKVVQATLPSAADSASSLAAEGYVITALGGDPTDGFVLIGTRVHGETAPRRLLIDNLATNPDLASLSSGYAVVGYLTDGAGQGAWRLLLER